MYRANIISNSTLSLQTIVYPVSVLNMLGIDEYDNRPEFSSGGDVGTWKVVVFFF